MVRLFVALCLPDSVRADLSAICGGLPSARWVAPENFHLKLRFIGEVGDEDVQEIDDALSRISASTFDVSLSGVGYFGTGRAARALWVKVVPSSELISLGSKTESALARAGCPPEARRFIPHITLARLKRAQLHLVEQFVADHSMFKLAPFPARAFLLNSSKRVRAGTIYAQEAVYPLTAC